MFTYDSIRQAPPDPLKDLVQSDLPEQIEVGETSDYWVYANRATKRIELVSKQTGEIIATCEPDGATQYGLSALQVGAAKDVFKL